MTMAHFEPTRRLIRNAAKCTACGVVIESNHRHDFRVHYCLVEPTPGKKWDGDGVDAKLVPSGEETFRFAVDGGMAYVRRVGFGYEDCNEWSSEADVRKAS
jgi:hypothetical protein